VTTPVPASTLRAPIQCAFCGQTHYLRVCPTAAEYLHTGCIICEDLFLLNADRSRIQRQGLENLQQAVDRHAKTITSYALSSNPPPLMIPSSAFISESYFLQCIQVAENHAMVRTIEDDDSGADALAITRSKAKNAVLDNIDAGPSQKKLKEANSTTSDTRAQSQTRSIEDLIPDTPAVPPKKTPAYVYESKAATPDAASCIYQNMLSPIVPNIMVTDLLAVSPDLKREAVEHCCMHWVSTHSSTTTLATTVSVPPPQIEHATPLCELKVMLNGVHTEMALLDEGLELVVIQEGVWKKTQAPINKNICMRMQTANGSSQDMAGCLEMLEIDVDGIKTWAHAYVIADAPYRLLLGRLWQWLVRLSKSETTDMVYVTIHDPTDIMQV